jgi:hypothetical protein
VDGVVVGGVVVGGRQSVMDWVDVVDSFDDGVVVGGRQSVMDWVDDGVVVDGIISVSLFCIILSLARFQEGKLFFMLDRLGCFLLPVG